MAGPKDSLAKGQTNGAAKKDDSLEPLVIQAISKRLRNTRKRLRGIEDIQAKVALGKKLNSDQEAALLSKPAVLATIEELEKVLTVVKEPLQQDLDSAASKGRAEGKAAAAKALTDAPPPKPVKTAAEWQREKQEAVSKACIKATAEAMAAAAAQAKGDTKAATDTAAKKAIDTLIELFYFSLAFDPYSPYPERLIFTNNANHTGVALAHEDFDLISLVGKLFTNRPYAPPMSHADALKYCRELATKYVLNPQDAMPQMAYTGKQVQDKIQLVKSLPYYEVLPGVQQGAMPIMPQASYPQAAPPPAAAPVPVPVPAPLPLPAAPQALPTPTLMSMVTPNTAQVSGENLVSHFFGSAVDVQPLNLAPPHPENLPFPNGSMHSMSNSRQQQNSTQQQQYQNYQQNQNQQDQNYQQEQQQHGGHKIITGPPAFAGDSDLGIEGVDYDDVQPRGTETPAIQAVHANAQESLPGSGAPSSNGQPHSGKEGGKRNNRRGGQWRSHNRGPKAPQGGQPQPQPQAQGHVQAQAEGGNVRDNGGDGRRREGGGQPRSRGNGGGGGARRGPRTGRPESGAPAVRNT